MIKLMRARHPVALVGFFRFGNVIGHTPEHFFDGFGRLAIVAAADVTTHQHLLGVIGQFCRRQVGGHGWGGERCFF
jgi:hypothetical protein